MPGVTSPGQELLDSALGELGKAAKALGIDPGLHRYLRSAEPTLIVALRVTMDDGRLEVFTGYRVQHSTARGPGKGGIPLPSRGQPRGGHRARDAHDL